jgi:hypothetical protein
MRLVRLCSFVALAAGPAASVASAQSGDAPSSSGWRRWVAPGSPAQRRSAPTATTPNSRSPSTPPIRLIVATTAVSGRAGTCAAPGRVVEDIEDLEVRLEDREDVVACGAIRR